LLLRNLEIVDYAATRQRGTDMTTKHGRRTANAERQAAYRKRHLGHVKAMADQRARLNLVVSPLTGAGLKRLASHYGVTQVAMLHRLIEDAEGRAIRPLRDDALRDYYGDAV
jgi:hypothetical protein